MVAIYARQSVDKKDSISIESQIETCRRKLHPDDAGSIKIYSDKGFSGSSTNRPQFLRLLGDIKTGQIGKIMVYKVDRISRSLLDFLKMQEDFSKYNVKFVSCLEDFDTSTSTGKMMMNMLMMFAEMERETIQKRITDNYYSRGERGFYLGGYAPFGYKKVAAVLDGKKTCAFEINACEAKAVKSIYEDYAYNHKSLSEIARRLNQQGIKTRRDSNWNMQGVSRILHNPIYVKANADIFIYLKSKGAAMNNPIEDYTGEKGCYVYGSAKKRKAGKFASFDADHITLGLHPGIIEPNLWLLTQSRFRRQNLTGNLGSGKLSWAQGLVKCMRCGYTCYVKKYKNTDSGKVFKYFYCRGKRNGTCGGSRKMLKTELLEKHLEKAILNRLESEKYITQDDGRDTSFELNALKIEAGKINSQITALVSQLGQASDITIKYVNEELERLDKEKTRIGNAICEYQLTRSRALRPFNIYEILNDWNRYGVEEKARIAKSIVNRVLIDGDDINIEFDI